MKPAQADKIGWALIDVRNEYARARAAHKPMQSPHEGLAVLWEEFEELKNEVFRKKLDREAVRHELVQVAAMAVSMILEVVDQ